MRSRRLPTFCSLPSKSRGFSTALPISPVTRPDSGYTGRINYERSYFAQDKHALFCDVARLLVSAVLLSLPLPARAQSDDTPPPSLGNATPAGLPGTVSCFNYYHFGSVQVDISPTVSSAVSGTPITFTGVIKNANTYPIVDGDVYIKIFRDRGDGSKDFNGPDVVEQYYALEGISIPAGGSKPVDITWNIPAYAASGSYKVATFFTVSHKFNLLGLPFTDDVVGNTASFRISGEQKAAVGFKKDAVTVGGEKYHFAAFPPREGASGDVKIEAVLVNPTNQSVTVPLTWTLYSWSGNDPNNAIGTRTEQVTIPASGQKLVSYTVSDSQYPVYLLTGSAKWHDASSIINVRFVREGKNRIRINFPAVTSYPLTAGAPATLFSCLHNAGTSDVVPGSRLVLSLRDAAGDLIHSYTYEGGVSGAMMGVAEDFTPKKTYDVFTLDAQLYEGQNLVDQSQVSYDCRKLNPSACASTAGEGGGSQDLLTSILEIVASLLAVVALIYLAGWSRKLGKGK